MRIQVGQQPDVEHVERDGRSMAVPLIIGGVVQFILPILAARPSDVPVGPGLDPAYFLGRVIGSILPVALVLWFGFGRKRDPRGWWKILAVLVPVALLANLVVAGGALGDRRKAGESISRAAEQLVKSDGGDVGPLKHSGATGEAGEMERVFLEYFRIVGATRQAYEREIAEAGIANLLDPQTLARDPGQRRARAGLVRARAAVARTVADEATLPQEFRRLVNQAAVGRNAREEALARFEEGRRRNAARTSRIHALDLEILAEMEQALDILRNARWRAAGNSFEFERDSDASAYERRYERIQALGSEQQRLFDEQNRGALSRIRGHR